MANPHPGLVMIGPAAEACSCAASTVRAYREQGLLRRWRVEYLAAHCDGGPRRNAALLVGALLRLVVVLIQGREVAVHVHAAAGRGFWREALFMALAIAARSPLIVQLHGGGFPRLYDDGGRAVQALLGFLLQRAACVVVPCESMRAWVRCIARRARVERVPPAVASPSITPEPRRPSLVIFLGRPEAAQGIFDLLEAISRLRTAVPDVRLLCAGEGDWGAAALHAERLGIADAVKFTNSVGPSGRRALFENAAAFALPSYDEALPPSLLEAMAAGVAPVVSPVGGVAELVVDGVSGLHAAPGDVATLQRQLRRLLIDRKLGERIGAAARESVRLRHAPERVVARLDALYAALGLPACAEPPAQAVL